jgi:phage terminase large subunit-like protein
MANPDIEPFNIVPPPSESKHNDDVLKRSYKDLLYFGRAFLPKDFLNKSSSPQFHHEVSKKLISTKPGARICNILPRGFGKSILSKAAILHKMCFSPQGSRLFMAWVAEEQGQAIDHLKYVKTHIEYNDKLSYYFGNMAGDAVGSRWTEKDIVTAKGDRLIAKGTSQRLRGRTEIDVRYTGIILDDFESELNTKTPERRNEIKRWIVSTVFPALEESPGNEGWIWMAGTIVHYDSFLQMVVEGYRDANREKRIYPWDVTFYRAVENDKPLWPDQFPLSKLESKKREFIEAGLVNKYAQEYMNDARDISDAAFKIDRIQYYNYPFRPKDKFAYLDADEDMIPVNIYIGVDIAATATKKSDYQAIVVIAVDKENNRYILEYFRERIPTFDLPDKIIEMAKKYQPVKRVTIETVAAQEMVRDMVTRMAKTDRRLMPGIFKGVKPPGGIKKEDRLETSLGPLVNSKRLYIRRNMTEIVDEFFEHPFPKNDDLMDALYYADYYAKPPLSKKITKDEYGKIGKRSVLKKYNWFTGARVN